MKRGTKAFVFATAMLLTVGGLKATIGHRYGYGHRMGCHNERFQNRAEMKGCHRYNHHNETKPNEEVNPLH